MRRFLTILACLVPTVCWAMQEPIDLKDDFYIESIDYESIPPPTDQNATFEGGYYVTAHISDWLFDTQVTATLTSNACYNKTDSTIVFRVESRQQNLERDYKVKGKRPVDQIARIMCKWVLEHLGE